MARSVFAIPNLQLPVDGGKAVAVPFAFTAAIQNIAGDLVNEQQLGGIDFVQSIYIDNSQNAVPFVITFQGLQYVVQCRAGRQGIFPVMCSPGSVQFSAVSQVAAPITVKTIMSNAPFTPGWWDV